MTPASIIAFIPPPLHRIGLRLAHAVRKRWWRLARPRLEGCRVIAIDADGRVLLIRHSYGSRLWLPPGGGVKRGEDAVATGRRELREETGCDLLDAREVGLQEQSLHGAANRVHIIAGRAMGTPRADEREVIDAVFFAPDALPSDMPAAIRHALPGWITAATAADRPRAAAAPGHHPAPTA